MNDVLTAGVTLNELARSLNASARRTGSSRTRLPPAVLRAESSSAQTLVGVILQVSRQVAASLGFAENLLRLGIATEHFERHADPPASGIGSQA